jgi:starch synthase
MKNNLKFLIVTLAFLSLAVAGTVFADEAFGVSLKYGNPETDKIVRYNYSASDFSNRAKNKLILQDEFNLPKDKNIPIISYSGRLDNQKGLGLIADIGVALLTEFDIQLIVNGGGDPKYRDYFEYLAKKFPKKVGINLRPDFTMPRHIFAGADMILVPSKFEPCGMVQMEAMRYGCIPIVRATGGLADTVTDSETGFVFERYSSWSLFATIVRALEIYKREEIWNEMVANAMNHDFSWISSANEYLNLYNRAINLAHKRKPGFVESPPIEE